MSNSIYSDPIGAKKADGANEESIRVFAQTMRNDYPGQWTDNRYSQSQHFTGVIYRAVMTRMTAIASSTVSVLKYRKDKVIAKALPQGNTRQNDEKWVQAGPGNPLVQLLDRPNPTETLAQVLACVEQQYCLTGSAHIWMNRDKWGVPRELYSLPTALLLAQPPSYLYPKGYWRVQQTYPGYFPSAGLMGWGANLDARDVLTIKAPHPLWRWDGYSPMTAGGVQLDILEAIDRARWATMDHAAMLNLILTMPGASLEQIKAVQASMSGTHEGAQNARRTLAIGGQVDGTGNPTWRADLIQPNAQQLDFPEGWEQMTKFCLALFGVPSSVAGMTSASNYAAFFAELKQFHTLTLQPQAKMLADWLSRGLATKFGKGVKIQIDVPKIDDTENQRAMLALNPGPLYTYNEARGAQNLPPVDGGDVPTEIYMAKLQQQMQPQPQDAAGAPGGVGEQPQGSVEDQVTSAAMATLGVPEDDGETVVKAQDEGGTHPPHPGLSFDKGKHRWVRASDAISTPESPKIGNRIENLARGLGTTAAKLQQDVPKWASMSNKEVMQAVKYRAKEATAPVAKTLASQPEARAKLERANEWAGQQAAKHADRVAQHLGVTPQRARALLEHAIKAVAKAAIEGNGSASGTLSVGGKKLKVGFASKPKPKANGKPQAIPVAPPRPDNRDGEGSLPSKGGGVVNRIAGATKRVKSLSVQARVDEICQGILEEMQA